jgi:glycosyl transferase family 25
MRIIVISLPGATDRRRSAAEQLTALGLDFEFFDAFDASTRIPSHFAEFDDRAYRLNCQRDPLPGEIGCYASHLSLWKHCAQTGEPVLILEDDFEALSGFVEAISVIENLLLEHDFIRLEPFNRLRAAGKRIRSVGQELSAFGRFTLHYLSDVPTQLTAYALSPSGGARLAKASERLVAPADKFVQRTWDHGVPIFALSPAIARTGPHSRRSTIGDRRSLKSRKLGLLIARAAYKGFGELRRIGFDRSQRYRLTGAGR